MQFDAIFLVVNFIAFFLALSAHEFAHALSAYYLGDRTAQYAGRLTLNPLSHIDLFGTILLPLFLILSNAGIVFGWAKPVPINYFNLKDQKWGPALVSVAGPAANFIFGVICIILLNLVNNYTNLGFNNLLVNFLFLLIIVNFVLMIFNLLPIPPLDGSKILFAILPDRYDNFKEMLERYGIIILFALLIFGAGFLNAIFNLMFKIIQIFI
ncbi:MAG: site-2 protease family protein [Candidatus Buchananbacteria bacterium]|nr:site-2 protease family protein [Candidatus Buchananbacteria bacterium]